MTYSYLRRIHLNDTDAAGVVYFTQGLVICHEAYEESLAEAGISLNKMIAEGNLALPIVHGEIDWLNPLYCGDRIQVNLNVKLGNSSEFAIAYQIFAVEQPDKLVAKAHTRHVCIDPQLRKRIELPENMLEWLNRWQ
ncbi:MAG: thioesterase family protein [Cyanobacteria bacterium J06621_8]